MSSSDFDYLAIDYTNKGLTIGFIVGIFGANFSLIFRTLRKGGFFYTPKSLTLISLAIGDIFLALFPLVVKAIYLFKVSDHGPSCSTSLSTLIYMFFLIHFVYATGLVVLAVQLIHLYRAQATSAVETRKNILKTFACSAVPWIVALLVVLPLMLAGSTGSPGSCIDHLTVQRLRAAYGVSVILPAVVAVIMCIIVMCIRFPSAYYTSPAISYQVTEQATFLNQQNTQIIHQQHVPTHPMENVQYPVGSTVVVHQFPVVNAGSQEPSTVPENRKNDPSLAGPTQYQVQQYPGSQQYPVQQYPLAQYPVQEYSTQPTFVIAAPMYPMQRQNTSGSLLPDPGREKKVLLLVSIIHFVCVVPYAVYTLGSNIDGYSSTNIDVIISLCLSWLSVFRSLITPAIFTTLNK